MKHTHCTVISKLAARMANKSGEKLSAAARENLRKALKAELQEKATAQGEALLSAFYQGFLVR